MPARDDVTPHDGAWDDGLWMANKTKEEKEEEKTFCLEFHCLPRAEVLPTKALT